MTTTATPPEYLATIRYRAAGGMNLQVHHMVGTPFPRRVLLMVLEEHGWSTATLEPNRFPGHSAGTQLIPHGYMPLRQESVMGDSPVIHGWTLLPRASDPGIRSGRALPSFGPVWGMGVQRMSSGAFSNWSCWCQPKPHLACCPLCPAKRQEQVYSYAIRPKATSAT